MKMDRREFVVSGAAAAVGLAGCAAWPAKTREEVVREVKFIDVHAHCFEELQPPVKGIVPFCTDREVLALYDRLDVACGCLLGLGQPEAYIGGMSVESLLRISAAHPDRFIPGCYIDPRCCGDSPHTRFDVILGYYADRGCRILGEFMPNLPILDARVQAMMAAAEEVGLPVTFDMAPDCSHSRYGIADEPGLPGLELTLRRFPKLKVIGHSQAFWVELSAYEGRDIRLGYPKGPVRKEGRIAELMRRYPNLHADLSAGSGLNAITRDPGYACAFLTEFQDRLLFGLDNCVPHPTDAQVGQVATLRKYFLEGGISETAFRKIAYGNAIRLLHLPV